MYSVDDEFGNQITTGLRTYDEAVQSARKYLAAHADTTNVEIYEEDGESWVLDRH